MSPTKHWIYVGMLGMSGMSEFMGVSSIYQWHSNSGTESERRDLGELPRLFSPNGRVLLANVQIEMSSELRCISALDGRRDTELRGVPGGGATDGAILLGSSHFLVRNAAAMH